MYIYIYYPPPLFIDIYIIYVYFRHDSNLFYGIYNTINDVHNQRQNYFTSLILNDFDIYF